MAFLENFENSISMDGGQPEWVDINDGLALKVFQSQCCDTCSCKQGISNNLFESQTSFEE